VMISSMVLFFRRDCDGGGGPAVEAPRIEVPAAGGAAEVVSAAGGAAVLAVVSGAVPLIETDAAVEGAEVDEACGFDSGFDSAGFVRGSMLPALCGRIGAAVPELGVTDVFDVNAGIVGPDDACVPSMFGFKGEYLSKLAQVVGFSLPINPRGPPLDTDDGLDTLLCPRPLVDCCRGVITVDVAAVADEVLVGLDAFKPPNGVLCEP
jgi:hypothetical protein